MLCLLLLFLIPCGAQIFENSNTDPAAPRQRAPLDLERQSIPRNRAPPKQSISPRIPDIV
ncbi:hypothetical protein OSTOST_01084, partial [Ostertagia ostertagi]